MLLTHPLRLVALALTAVMLISSSAGASPGDSVERRGECDSGPGEWKIVVRTETSTTLRVRFRIQNVQPGHLWDVFLSDDGTRFFSATKRANDQGEVNVTAFTRNRAGADTIAAYGHNRANGVSCHGSVSY
jgi:hypothetical protein